MVWNELKLKIKSEDQEKAAAITTAAFSGELFIEDYSDIYSLNPLTLVDDYISKTLLAKNTGFSIIHAYIPQDESISEIETFIRERLSAENIPFDFSKSLVQDTDWAENWKQYYHPVKIGSRLVICPSWQTYEPLDNDIVITLDPGMSFGTGEHESTKLCLEMLGEIIQGKERVLDVGTGSGILGISAIKLGADSAAAIDIEADSVRVAAHNAKINHVEHCFSVFCRNISDFLEGTKELEGEFDIITANIVADVHIAACEEYYKKIRRGGNLILSGIISDNTSRVKKALKTTGFQIIEIKSLNDWVAIIAKKPVGIGTKKRTFVIDN